MLSEDRRKLENQLMVMGLAKLNDPNLIQQLALLITVQKAMPPEEFFRDMLGECEPEKRKEMYEAMRPLLGFKVKPLEHYIDEIKAKASAAATRDKPITVGEEQFHEVDQREATGVLVDLRCYKCTRGETFSGITPADAVIKARAFGWVRDLVMQKEVCPKCLIYVQ